MNQPWGLSGPQFLLVYGAGMAASFASPFLVALLARARSAATAPVDDPVLDPYEVGYLAGGARRAAEVVIGELTASGTLRVDSGGRISRADRAKLAAWSAQGPHGISAAGLPDGLRTARVRKLLARDPGIISIGTRLRAERLLIARSWITAERLTALAAFVALMGAGALRVAEGDHNRRPTDYLQLLMVATGYLGLLSFLQLRGHRPSLTMTIAGSDYLDGLRPKHAAALSQKRLAAARKAALQEKQAEQRAEFRAQKAEWTAWRRGGWRSGTVRPVKPTRARFAARQPAVPLPELAAAMRRETMLFSIALAGLVAVADPALRAALLMGLPSAGGNSGCGGGGGGGGCGGGCGG